MYALIDCNNFYCSCERVFDPALARRPMVVLSNNDGCIISRSDEAKQLGIAMGTPGYLAMPTLKEKQVAVFSSNYTLYGDMSDRVMQTLAGFVPRMEIYSIDEAFLDMNSMPYNNLLDLGVNMRRTVLRNTGIPVSIGIAPTKTLAKMANRYAKHKHKKSGVFWAANQHLIDEMLQNTAVADVWGIGQQYALLLRRNGFQTAADFARAPDEFIRDKMSVVGLRLLKELRGIPSIKWDDEIKAKKNICMSRAFGKRLTTKDEIAIAVANYAVNCAQKLRAQKTCCGAVQVFLQTNPHKTEEQQYFRSVIVELETPANDNGTLTRHALKGLDLIFMPGYAFMKAGVLVMELVPDNQVQTGLFENERLAAAKKLMHAMDAINAALGKNKVRMATQQFSKTYQMRAEHLSPCYTTNIDHIIKVKN